MSGKVLIPETAPTWQAPGQLFTTIKKSKKPASSLFLALALLFAFISASFWAYADILGLPTSSSLRSAQAGHPPRLSAQFKNNVLAQCAALRSTPGPPAGFSARDESDRHEPGTHATLIRNCLIFTGRDNGTDVVRGDILLEKGIIRTIGEIADSLIKATPNLTVVDANGAWVTPGLGQLLLTFNFMLSGFDDFILSSRFTYPFGCFELARTCWYVSATKKQYSVFLGD
jgi:hypothetical protein